MTWATAGGSRGWSEILVQYFHEVGGEVSDNSAVSVCSSGPPTPISSI